MSPTAMPSASTEEREQDRTSPPRLRRARWWVAVIAVLVIGVVGYRQRTTDPQEVAVRDRVPILLDQEWQSRWVALVPSDPDKDQRAAEHLERARDDLPSIWTERHVATALFAQTIAIEAAKTRPMRSPIDRSSLTVTKMDDIEVDGDRASAHVWFETASHVRPYDGPPPSIGTFVTDSDGWWRTTSEEVVRLEREGGIWKLDTRFDPHGGG